MQVATPAPLPHSIGLAFVDLETTGANPAQDRITEIGLVLVDNADGTVTEWSTLVNPEQTISPFIEALTGISNTMVAHAPRFEQVMADVLRQLEGRLFIAHNARFDYGFLKAEFARAGQRFRAPTLCTVKLSRKLFPEHAKHNLDALMSRHGLSAESRHRALSDARLIHQFWRILEQHPGPAALEAALRQQLRPAQLPPHLDPMVVEDLPEAPGVFTLFNAAHEALYVGRARDLHKQVLSHFASTRHIALNLETHGLDWQECSGELGTQLLEARQIKALQPRHNRHLKASPEACTWLLEPSADGRLVPRLVRMNEVDFKPSQACHGLYRQQREALQALTALATELRLCPSLLGLEPGANGNGQPCTTFAQKRCKGACAGKESLAQHNLRLMSGLLRLRLQAWPHPGPALLREGRQLHLIHAWRYLGSVQAGEPEATQAELHSLLSFPLPAFDKDIYRILVRHIARLEAVPGNLSSSPEKPGQTPDLTERP